MSLLLHDFSRIVESNLPSICRFNEQTIKNKKEIIQITEEQKNGEKKVERKKKQLLVATLPFIVNVNGQWRVNERTTLQKLHTKKMSVQILESRDFQEAHFV